MTLIKINKSILKHLFIDFKFLICAFLIWNFFKLFQIEADPIIQLLNLLLSLGIYFVIEDKDIQLHLKLRSCFMGIIFFLIVFIRSLLLNTVSDKFYYLLLPSGIFSICLIAQNFREIKYFRKIILIALLLPIRRIFFYVFNPILLFFTKYLSFFSLIILGADPVLRDRSIFLESSELVISDGCGGADNMYFVIAAILIYSFIFRLRAKLNLSIIYSITFIVPLAVNVFRNTLLALFVNLDTNNKDVFFTFFHDSYGSLIFSFISVSIVSYIYFKLLNNELDS